FVENCRANGGSRVDHIAIGWIVEGVSNRRQVVTAPLRRVVALRNLLGDEVPKNGEFLGEVMIDANDLLLQVGRAVGTSDERSRAGSRIDASCGRREHAGTQQ